MAPSKRGWEEIGVSIALVSLAALSVVLRFAARFKRKLSLGIDDWLAAVGQVLLFAMLIELILWASIGGNGKHIKDVTPQEIPRFFKIFLSNELTYVLASPTIKLSIIFFYRRLFSIRRFKTAANIVIGLTVAWAIAVFLVACFQCRPLAKYWDPKLEGYCIDPMKYILGNQGVNVALDFFILALPWPMVWGLQRPWKDKIALSGVFLIGAFVCSASVYRIVTLKQIKNEDITYTVYDATIWTLVEPCIGMVCGCLPVARGLFPATTPGRRKSYLERSKQSDYTRGRSPKPFRDAPGYVKMDHMGIHEARSTVVKSEEHLDGSGEEVGDGIMVRTRVEVV